MQDNRFPHLTGATPYPGTSTIDVYKYENEFDYTRWKPDTVIKVCNVPWCGDYDNVVDFGSEKARDAYLDNIPGESVRLTTMLHMKPDTAIKLPFPVSVMQHMNYLIVDLPTPTSDEQPLDYATLQRKRRYLFFVDDAIESAGSTTLCTLHLDMWATFIHDVSISYMMLERGHAPVAATSASAYLDDPISQSGMLLAPDDSFADAPRIAKSIRVKTLDTADRWCVMATYARLDGAWGTLDAPQVPAITAPLVQGAPAPFAYAFEPGSFADVMATMDAQAPQMKACIQGVFFISKQLVTTAESYQILGFTMYRLEAQQQVSELLGQLQVSDFGYPAEAQRFAKLYTYPYACLAVSDADGNESLVRIEDTDGSVTLATSVSLVMPWVSIDCRLIDVGGVTGSISFYNANTHSYSYGGRWVEHLWSLDIPVYQVTQSAAIAADWSSDYTRAQAKLAADTAQTNANDSANVAQANSNASADTARTNADESASATETTAARNAANITANNAASVAANNALTSSANAAASDGTHYSNALASATTSWANASSSAGYEAQQDALAVAASNLDTQTVASGAAAIVGGVGQAATGDIAGGILTAVNGVANAAVGWATANASNTVSQSNSDLIYNATIAANNASLNNSTAFNNNATNRQNTQRDENNNTQNAAMTTIATNNANLTTANAGTAADLTRGNASRTHDTAYNTAQNSYNLATSNASRNHDVAIAGIAADLAQRGVASPEIYGSAVAGAYGTTRPRALFASVLTQPDGAIMQAASSFARYGYRLNQQWKVTRWQVMKHFTYWKASEVWCAGAGNAIESAQQAIKDILVNGTTVWGDPEEIGKVSVYDN